MGKRKIFNRIPKTVIVKNIKYKVEIKDLGEKLAGSVTKHKKKILLNKRLKRHEIESTLIHEILHSIDWSLKEKKVLKLEKRLVRLFRKNKWKIVI